MHLTYLLTQKLLYEYEIYFIFLNIYTRCNYPLMLSWGIISCYEISQDLLSKVLILSWILVPMSWSCLESWSPCLGLVLSLGRYILVLSWVLTLMSWINLKHKCGLTHTHTHIHTHTRTHTHMYVSMYVRIYLCMYIHKLYTHTHSYMHACIHTHIHTYMIYIHT